MRRTALRTSLDRPTTDGTMAARAVVATTVGEMTAEPAVDAMMDAAEGEMMIVEDDVAGEMIATWMTLIAVTTDVVAEVTIVEVMTTDVVAEVTVIGWTTAAVEAEIRRDFSFQDVFSYPALLEQAAASALKKGWLIIVSSEICTRHFVET